MDREAEVGRDIGCRALRERATGVSDGGQQVAGVSLEVGEIVLLTGHKAA